MKKNKREKRPPSNLQMCRRKSKREKMANKQSNPSVPVLLHGFRVCLTSLLCRLCSATCPLPMPCCACAGFGRYPDFEALWESGVVEWAGAELWRSEGRKGMMVLLWAGWASASQYVCSFSTAGPASSSVWCVGCKVEREKGVVLSSVFLLLLLNLDVLAEPRETFEDTWDFCQYCCSVG
jgi:hypothetical protein